MKRSRLKRGKGFKSRQKALKRSPLNPGTKGLKRSGFAKRTRKKTGERDLFVKLYHKRGGVCEVTGERLLPPEHSMFHCQGSHLLPKGTYPDYRMDERNIAMITIEKHDEWGAWSKDRLEKIDPRWKDIVERYRELRIEANER